MKDGAITTTLMSAQSAATKDPKIVVLLDALDKTKGRLRHNFFILSVKLLSEEHITSNAIKHYDKPQPAYQRVLEPRTSQKGLKLTERSLFKTLNGLNLKDH